jgi:hypothetical protein
LIADAAERALHRSDDGEHHEHGQIGQVKRITSQRRALLKDLTVSHAGGDVYLVNRTRGWDGLDRALGIDTDRKWATITTLRAWRRAANATIRRTLSPHTN